MKMLIRVLSLCAVLASCVMSAGYARIRTYNQEIKSVKQYRTVIDETKKLLGQIEDRIDTAKGIKKATRRGGENDDTIYDFAFGDTIERRSLDLNNPFMRDTKLLETIIKDQQSLLEEKGSDELIEFGLISYNDILDVRDSYKNILECMNQIDREIDTLKTIDQETGNQVQRFIDPKAPGRDTVYDKGKDWFARSYVRTTAYAQLLNIVLKAHKELSDAYQQYAKALEAEIGTRQAAHVAQQMPPELADISDIKTLKNALINLDRNGRYGRSDAVKSLINERVVPLYEARMFILEYSQRKQALRNVLQKAKEAGREQQAEALNKRMLAYDTYFENAKKTITRLDFSVKEAAAKKGATRIKQAAESGPWMSAIVGTLVVAGVLIEEVTLGKITEILKGIFAKQP